MILGEFKGHFPRIMLTLPGIQEEIEVEFVIDTGFDGDLALPEILIDQLKAVAKETQFVELAGGFRQRCYAYELPLFWNGEVRVVEVLTLDGNPLIGNSLWDGLSLFVENREGGEVTFETD